MKKGLWILSVAVLLVASAAFAGDRNLVAQPGAKFVGVPGAAEGPATTDNDDGCDISNAPAATLLLPYFEVDINAPGPVARTTLFTVTNTSFVPQIAHVTVWTDWSFAVLDFNLFLTGYDVQSINIFDILVRGFIGVPPPATANTSYNTTVGVQSTGNSTIIGTAATPRPFNASAPTYNPNFLIGAATTCLALPGQVPTSLLVDVQRVLTTGLLPSACGSTRVGGTHVNAIGYITIDVAATCSISLPTEPTYFPTEILFDNTLIGEYMDVDPGNNFAGGSPMVHIRAVPEGGAAGSVPTGTTNLPYTFYDRYTPAVNRRLDRRQPLPSTFAARYISGGVSAFDTRYKIWREGLTPGSAPCIAYGNNNRSMAFAVIVRFDEAENSNVNVTNLPNLSPQPIVFPGTLPETSQTTVSNTDIFPPDTRGGVGGWMFMNLNNVAGANAATGGQGTRTVNPYSESSAGTFEGAGTSTAAGGIRQSQNWVVVSMFAQGRFSVDFNAAWLGNGCSVSPAVTTQIGPTGGVFVCPAGAVCQATLPAGTNATP